MIVSDLLRSISMETPVKCKVCIDADDGFSMQIRMQPNRHHIAITSGGFMNMYPFTGITDELVSKLEEVWSTVLALDEWRAASLSMTIKPNSETNMTRCLDVVHEFQHYMETHARARKATWEYAEKVKVD